MERGVRFCPKWHSALWFVFLILLSLFLAAKPEITCRSCHPDDKWRARKLLLKMDLSEFATGSAGEVFGNGDGAVRFNSASAETRQVDCVAESAECVLDQGKYIHSRRKRKTDRQRSNGGMPAGENNFTLRQVKVSDLKFNGQLKTGVGKARSRLTSATQYKQRVRRNSPSAFSGDDKVKSPGLALSQESLQLRNPQEGITSSARRRVARSEIRWSGENRRTAGLRQDELKLTSSTFALTGDSSHNQAMVHWSGQNSSVSKLSRALKA